MALAIVFAGVPACGAGDGPSPGSLVGPKPDRGAGGGAGPGEVPANFPVVQGLPNQGEPYIAMDPNNPNRLAAISYWIDKEVENQGFDHAYFSEDGGRTWVTRELPAIPHNGVLGTDPSVAIDLHGRVYVGYDRGDFLPQMGEASVNGFATATVFTDDFGKTWSSPVITFAPDIPNHIDTDKSQVMVDIDPQSPFRDNVYDANLKATVNDNGDFVKESVAFFRSGDRGNTFEGPFILDEDPDSLKFGANLATGPNGEVYVVWAHGQSPGQAPPAVVLDRSFDGGRTFHPDVLVSPLVIANFTDGMSIPPQNQRNITPCPYIGVDRSRGPHNGRIHLAWIDQVDKTKPFADGELTGVFYTHSDDLGATWAPPVRVTDAPQAFQLLVTLAVDPIDGTVVMAWHDTRNDPQSFATDLYLTYSHDGGETFAPNLRVTAASTNEHCDHGACMGDIPSKRQYGDYEGLAVRKGHAFPIWTDRRHGVAKDEDIWTADVTIPPKE